MKLAAHDQLPTFQQSLDESEAKLARLKEELASSVNGRDAAINTSVKAAPDYVPPNDGLLNQIKILETIVDSDREIYLMVLLIDLVCFGLELAAVLAKITVTIPSSYGALLVKRSLRRRIKRIADGVGLVAGQAPKAEPGPSSPSPFSLESLFGVHPVGNPANDNTQPPAAANDNSLLPPKRKRGRPKGSVTKSANGRAHPGSEGEDPGPA